MRRLLLTLPLLLIASCGGEDAADQPDVSSAQDVAALIGCDGFKPDGDAELYVAETGSCRMAGEFVVVNYFDSAESVAQYRDAASSMGTRLLYGERWAVYAEGATLKAAQAEAGGTIK